MRHRSVQRAVAEQSELRCTRCGAGRLVAVFGGSPMCATCAPLRACVCGSAMSADVRDTSLGRSALYVCEAGCGHHEPVAQPIHCPACRSRAVGACRGCTR